MSIASRPPSDADDWLPLVDGVRVRRRWLTEHAPRLLAAWDDAADEGGRSAVAAQILRAAAHVAGQPTVAVTGDRYAAWAWQAVAMAVDRRLTHGPDWPPLAAALSRAHAAGYDVALRLPALVTTAPPPDRHPARELH